MTTTEMTQTAAAARKTLRATYGPGFTVRQVRGAYGLLHVAWVDGPTERQVAQLLATTHPLRRPHFLHSGDGWSMHRTLSPAAHAWAAGEVNRRGIRPAGNEPQDPADPTYYRRVALLRDADLRGTAA